MEEFLQILDVSVIEKKGKRRMLAEAAFSALKNQKQRAAALSDYSKPSAPPTANWALSI